MGIFEKAQIDFLTGFFLRGSFGPFLEKAMREAVATKGIITLALVDIDHFKRFNDTYGHDFGDEVLKYAASTIRLTMDENQTYFFRHGGDEFIVAFVGKGPKEAYQLLRTCKSNLLHRPFLLRNKFLKITLSIGIASYPHDAGILEDLLARADSAMYYSKRHGRNRITLWSTIRYLKLRTFFVMIGAVSIVALALFAGLRVSSVKEKIAPYFKFFDKVNIAEKLEGFDKVVLKTGTVFEGKIVVEDDKMVILKLGSDKGTGTLRFEKSKIAGIKRAGAR